VGRQSGWGPIWRRRSTTDHVSAEHEVQVLVLPYSADAREKDYMNGLRQEMKASAPPARAARFRLPVPAGASVVIAGPGGAAGAEAPGGA